MTKIYAELLVVIIAISLILPLASSHCSADFMPENRGHEIDPYKNVEGGNWSFKVGIEDDELKLKDVFYKDGTDVYKVFKEMKITVKGYHGEIEFPIPDFRENIFKVNQEKFRFEIKDTTEGRISITPLEAHDISVKIELARDTEVGDYQGKNEIYLDMGNGRPMKLSWSGSTDFSLNRKPDRLISMYLLLKEQGEFSSKISEDIPVARPTKKVLARISMDASGELGEMPLGSGLGVSKEKAAEGEVELKVSGDFDESKVINLNLDRELIGSRVEDISDMKVSIDGEELEYREPDELYGTEKEGYYVNMSKTKTSVYIRMNFSEHNVRIYEDVEEGGPSGVQPGSFAGLILGILVVVAGTVILFKKE